MGLEVGLPGVVLGWILGFFSDPLKSLIFGPRLTLEIRFKQPDCQKINLYIQFPSSGRVEVAPNYQFRLRVKNQGLTSARNVLAVINLLEKKEGGEWVQVPDFLMTDLIWTHGQFERQRTLPILSPKADWLIDFGHVIHPQQRHLANEVKPVDPIPQSEISFCFDLSIKPANFYHIIGNGKYRCWITVSAENARPVRKQFIIKLGKKWFDDQEKMFTEDGIQIIEY